MNNLDDEPSLVSMKMMGSSKRTRRPILGSSPRFYPSNRITLLENGAAYFPALEAALDRARQDVYLETYIYAADTIGWRIADALVRAARRGVTVHVLIDGFGSKDLAPALPERLREGGVKTLIYRPKISPWTFRRKRLRRMHRKTVVIDRQVAFVGGINIIDDRESTGQRLPRFDYAVAVEGPLVAVIRRSVRHLWARVARSPPRQAVLRRGTLPRAISEIGTMRAAFLVRDNFRHRRQIEAAYLRAIDRAEVEILLASAYFLPGINFRHALVRAAGRGVRVVLLLQGRFDHRLQHYATQALYGYFLAAGIEIYEFHQSFLHAKVAAIDGQWATVGSSNIDPFSLLLSLEANVVVDDPAFAAALAQSLERNVLSHGGRVLRDTWNLQPAGMRFISWLSYGLLRLMLGISGYHREIGQVRGGRKQVRN